MYNNTTSSFTVLSAQTRISLAIYFCIIVILSTCFNGMLLHILRSVKSLHSISHAFICNLAIGNLVTTLLKVPFDINFHLRGFFPQNVFLCGMAKVLFMASLPMSVLNLTALTSERLITIVFPLKKKLYFTNTATMLIISFIWFYSILVGLFPVLYQGENAVKLSGTNCFLYFTVGYSLFQTITNLFIPIVSIAAMNAWIFLVANRQSARIIEQTHSFQVSRRRSSWFSINIKAAKRICLLVVVFLFCWLTYVIIVLCNVLCVSCYNPLTTWIGNAINYSEAFLNPLLYGFMNKDIRKQILKECGRFYNSRSSSEVYLEVATRRMLRSPSTLNRMSSQDTAM